jgi:hypothetical protein
MVSMPFPRRPHRPKARCHHVQTRAQLTRGRRGPVQGEGLLVGTRVGEARHALAQALVHRELEGAPGLVRGPRGRLDERLGVVHEDPCGLAVGPADDLAAAGGLRRASHSAQLHGAGVGKDRVPVGALQDDGVARRGRTQLLVGRKAPHEARRRGPLAFVPPPPSDPLARLATPRRLGHPGDDLRVAPRAHEVDVEPREADPHQVRVGVVEARYHGQTLQVDDTGPGTHERLDLACAADGQDVAAAQRQGVGTGALRVHGVHDRVPENEIRLLRTLELRRQNGQQNRRKQE